MAKTEKERTYTEIEADRLAYLLKCFNETLDFIKADICSSKTSAEVIEKVNKWFVKGTAWGESDQM